MITYKTQDGNKKQLEGFPVWVKMYTPLRTMVTFLPRALQPTPAPGRGGTSNPIQLTPDEVSLLLALNPMDVQREWLIKPTAGWLYRVMDGFVKWSSAVALAGNQVMVDRVYGNYLRVIGVPYDAEMSLDNINPILRPYWCHRVLVRNMFQEPHDPFGIPTYSPMWDRFMRPNSYPLGELWIHKDHLSLVRRPLPFETV
jgi:hypothetical protein